MSKSSTHKKAAQKDGREQSKKAAGTKRAAKTEETPAAAIDAGPEPADDSGELVVFAFRLTRGERDEIHAAAGAAKASKFVKAVALAAARRDATGLEATIRTAEENRKG